MPFPLNVPRINNNDDFVRIVRLAVGEGRRVEPGETVAEIETDKSVAEVTADQEGYVLKILCAVGEQVAVGSVMMWLGAGADEAVPLPRTDGPSEPARPGSPEPTAKARALLARYHLSVEDVPVSSRRLSAEDVEAHVARRGPGVKAGLPPARNEGPRPQAPGTSRDLSVEERGMLHTVTWHQEQAVATYLEIEYDPKPWDTHAAAFAAERKLMMSPLLPLMAHRLVRLAAEHPKLNATLLDGRMYQYSQVNLGYTVQAGETLYLVVLRDAGSLDSSAFLDSLGELQRHAIGKKLRPEETQGATVSFSSMARWNVSRHMPILPPFTSLMVAHAAPRHTGMAVLGATYDHRVLSGFDVARLLQQLSRPPG